MVPQWFIEAKRDGKAHTSEEIHTWISMVTDGSLPDYQLSAWLMAVCLKGMTPEETAALTDAMMHSGETITFDGVHNPLVDKHSTGGIGDKISIPLAPLAAAMGLAVPMISGRGLGITGGTLDKLESIKGFNTQLSVETFKRITLEVGCCMIGQTPTLAPADKRMYAMRDVTGTVPSIPLITASIMSKKLAEGAQGLLFDVKFGSGAFMKTREEAECLAASLVKTGEALGRNCTAILTDMNQPHGAAIGNALEVAESIAILSGAGPDDVRELTLKEAAHMALLGGLYDDYATAYAAAQATLDSGAALAKFREMLIAQGGDPDAPLPQAPATLDILAPVAGTLRNVDAATLGRVALQLGAGRTQVTDTLDLSAGISNLLSAGTSIQKGDRLCTLHGATTALLEANASTALNAFLIGD